MAREPDSTSFRETVAAIAHDFDAELKPTDAGYGELCILIASMILGADEDQIARGLEADPEFVGTVGSRLRTAGIWSGAAIDPAHRAGWDDDKDGGTAFWMAHLVATGGAEIVGQSEDGGPLYRMTAAGKARAKRLFSDPKHPGAL